ncbi:MAG: HD domain-containing protein [Treponemataceae bacterium]|nr:HD domain-containing protein [Treponemataceae bacterium]
MEAPISSDVFFNENVANVNKLIQRLLYVTFIFPILLFLAEWKNSAAVTFQNILFMVIFCFFINMIEVLLNRSKLTKISMYFGLIGMMILISYFGCIGTVYIAYIFVPILSTLYLKSTVTHVTSFVCFILTVTSIWFNSQNLIWISSSGEYYSVEKIFVLRIFGIIIEYIFAYLAVICLTKRSKKTLKDLSDTLETKTQLFEQLESSTELLVKAQNKQLTYNNMIQTNQLKIIEFVAEVLGSHDIFTGNHISHTRTYVVLIAEELRKEGLYADILTDETIKLYSSAAFLHDIGKVHIPEGILNKQGKFTPAEFEMMKSHTTEGLKLLNYLPKIDDGHFNEIAKEMAYCHHEKWDGTGYPQNLVGNQIPFPARVMAAADVLDALISQRLYKEPMTVEDAMKVFEENKGSHFEPCIAEAVIRSKDKIKYINEEFKRKESEKNSAELEWWQNYHSGRKSPLHGGNA